MSRTKVTRNYQITIPKDIREDLEVDVGDTIVLIPEKEGVKMKKFDVDAFKKAFGSWKIKESSVDYVRKLRKESEKRMKRLGL